MHCTALNSTVHLFLQLKCQIWILDRTLIWWNCPTWHNPKNICVITTLDVLPTGRTAGNLRLQLSSSPLLTCLHCISTVKSSVRTWQHSLSRVCGQGEKACRLWNGHPVWIVIRMSCDYNDTMITVWTEYQRPVFQYSPIALLTPVLCNFNKVCQCEDHRSTQKEMLLWSEQMESCLKRLEITEVRSDATGWTLHGFHADIQIKQMFGWVITTNGQKYMYLYMNTG